MREGVFFCTVFSTFCLFYMYTICILLCSFCAFFNTIFTYKNNNNKKNLSSIEQTKIEVPYGIQPLYIQGIQRLKKKDTKRRPNGKMYHNGLYNSSRKDNIGFSDSSDSWKSIVMEILVEVYEVGLTNYDK